MTKSVWVGVWCTLALLLAACCAERDEVKDDAARYVRHQDEQFAVTRREVRQYIRANINLSQPLQRDVHRFLVWRKHEWWQLEQALAYHIHYDWKQIEELTKAVARYWGYNVSKWPQVPEDILRFMHEGQKEWVNLVQDVTVYWEYHLSQTRVLKEQLGFQLQLADQEAVNLQVDVMSFLEWREREYRRLIESGKDYWQTQLGLVENFRGDLRRFVSSHIEDRPQAFIEQGGAFIKAEVGNLPRLRDDCYRYWVHHMHNIQLAEDAARSWNMAQREAVRLRHAVGRFAEARKEETRLLMADFHRWIQTYEREVRPLTEDVKRYIEYHLRMRHVTMADIRRFFVMADEEAMELKQDVQRFVAYGGEEWTDFKAALQRFISCRRRPFGTRSMPMPGDTYGSPGVERNPMWRSEMGNTSY